MTNPIRPRLNRAVRWAVVAAVFSSQLLPAQAASPTLLQRIRQLIGLNRPIAAGGSRSSGGLYVCVITPRTELDAQGQARAAVALPRPTLLAAGPLNEVRIDRGGQVAWRKLASSTTAIEGPIDWPLDPVQPGESLTLLLRPRGASGADFARIQLRGLPEPQLRANEVRAIDLGSNAAAWRTAVESALDANQVPLAWALLFSPQAPASPDLNALRREVLQRGCGSEAGAVR